MIIGLNDQKDEKMDNDLNTVESATPTAAPVEPSVSVAPAPAAEEMIPKSQVDSIVHGRLQDYKRKFESQSAQLKTEAVDHDHIRAAFEKYTAEREAAEREQQFKAHQALQHEAERARLEQVGIQLQEKFKDAQQRYEDFNDIVGNLDAAPEDSVFSDPKVATISVLANQFDNAGDMIYQLLKNPEKLDRLDVNNPVLLHHNLKRLSASLKSNADSENRSRASQPIQKISPSHVPSKPDNNSRGPEYWRSVNKR